MNHLPAPELAPQIRWGAYTFTRPTLWNSFVRFLPPPSGGIYVVMVLDHGWSPQTYRPLYFGQCESFCERLTTRHEKLPSWHNEACGSALYVSLHTMPAASTEGREARENELIDHYHPPCNIRGNLLSLAMRTSSALTPPTASSLSENYNSYLGLGNNNPAPMALRPIAPPTEVRYRPSRLSSSPVPAPLTTPRVGAFAGYLGITAPSSGRLRDELLSSEPARAPKPCALAARRFRIPARER
jgi:hypothetical protein